MNDDDADAMKRSWDASKAQWDERLKSPEPMQAFVFDQTMRVTIAKGGGVILDCPCFGLLGHDRLGVVRVALSPEAEQILKAALESAERTRGVPTPAPSSRPSH